QTLPGKHNKAGRQMAERQKAGSETQPLPCAVCVLPSAPDFCLEGRVFQRPTGAGGARAWSSDWSDSGCSSRGWTVKESGDAVGIGSRTQPGSSTAGLKPPMPGKNEATPTMATQMKTTDRRVVRMRLWDDCNPAIDYPHSMSQTASPRATE